MSASSLLFPVENNPENTYIFFVTNAYSDAENDDLFVLFRFFQRKIEPEGLGIVYLNTESWEYLIEAWNLCDVFNYLVKLYVRQRYLVWRLEEPNEHEEVLDENIFETFMDVMMEWVEDPVMENIMFCEQFRDLFRQDEHFKDLIVPEWLEPRLRSWERRKAQQRGREGQVRLSPTDEETWRFLVSYSEEENMGGG